MEEALKDERFSHILTDPRFRKMPKNVSKVTVDKRFKGMFTDKKFKEKCTLDKRGRPLILTPSENLKNLYEVSSESSDDETNNKDQEGCEENESKRMPEKVQQKKNYSDATNFRGKAAQLSKSSSESESEESQDDQMSSEDELDKESEKQKLKQLVNLKKKSVKDKRLAIREKAAQLNKSSSESESEESQVDQISSEDELEKKSEKQKMKQLINLKKKSIQDKRLVIKEKAAQHNKSSSESESEESQDDQMSSEDEIEEKSEKQKVKQLVNRKKKLIKDKMNIEATGFIQIEEKEASSSDEESDDDSSSESDDDIKEQTGEFDHRWEEHQNEAPDTNEITRRIAVCNMDWDRIRAQDLFVCFNSFKPSDSNILSVKIYPSEFGLKRMEEEKIHGPSELVEETLPLEEEVVTDKKGSKYHREKLRQYQMNRLKYYYAVVECDSPETANTLYEQLNGMEYESSSIRFDLRFIPDDVTFDQEPVSTTDKVPDPTGYKPRLFVTTALQQVKVNLTWDETDPRRREVFQKAFTDPDSIENDIQEYLACSSDDSDEGNKEEGDDKKLSMNERISKYKALLHSLEEEEQKKTDEKNKYELEITWEPGFREKTEEIVKEKMKSKSSNPFEEMLQKKKEERKLKKKQMKTKQKQDDDDESSNISGEDSEGASNKNVKEAKRLAELALISDSRKVTHTEENSNEKKINSKQMKRNSKQKKIKAHKMDNFKFDVNDPRFSAIYSSHLYNIDPSDPHFKKTEGNIALIQEKQRKIKSTDFHERNSKSKRVKYS